MARVNKSEARDWTTEYADGGIQQVGLSDEILGSMRSYIDYTLTDRALPYIDGLKPVHRAILWCMWDKGLKSTSSRKKSLSVSGDVVGRAHPHSGDAVYGAISGMTRSNADDSRCGACSLNLSLIDGKGNWGAEFFDRPASPRYTEIRLSKSGEDCVRDVAKGAVFMNPTFDTEWVIPEVLPVRLPLLLINGCDGLAYGYNVQWLPHNPSEAIDACLVRIDNPECSVEDIRKVLPGPDFPSGGIIVDRDENGISMGLSIGKGNMSVTSRYTIERIGRRNVINFYQTPYLIARSGGKKTDKIPASIVMGISRFAEEHPDCGITDVKNLSDKDHECLIEVSVKASVNAEAVAAMLVNPQNRTRLTETVSYRQSAVIGDYEESNEADASGASDILRMSNLKPMDLGILEYLDSFIKFRCACVINASRSEKKKLETRCHLQEGLLTSLLDIDEVIAVIRKSQNKDTAHKNLKKRFRLDDEQAAYILGISLARLTRSDRIEIENECKKLNNRIKELNTILSNSKNVLGEVRKQLEELRDAQTIGRRTTIISSDGKVLAKAQNETKEQLEMAKRIATYASSSNGVQGKNIAEDESAAATVPSLSVSGTTTVFLTADGKLFQTTKKTSAAIIQTIRNIDINSEIIVVLEDGNSIRVPAYELPTTPSFISKRCVGVMSLGTDGKTDGMLSLTTSDGKVKVLDLSTLTKNKECPVISLARNARLLSARPYEEESFFVFITSNANLLRFPVSSVNAQGRTSAGVAGIKLVDNAKVIYANICSDKDTVLTFTNKTGKSTPLIEFPPKGRGSQGVRCHRFLKGETELTKAFVGANPKMSTGELNSSTRDASGTALEGIGNIIVSLE